LSADWVSIINGDATAVETDIDAASGAAHVRPQGGDHKNQDDSKD
jgi:hypothetical protein